VAIIAIGRMVHFANQAADNLEMEDVRCTVLDPRTLSPLDEDTILEVSEEAGRVVIVDESHPRCNAATDIAALIAQKAFEALKAPIKIVSAPHTPVPFSPELEDQYIPDSRKIESAVRQVVAYAGRAPAIP
jgi:pyruvate dehydrogenase E1 component beta subunit